MTDIQLPPLPEPDFLLKWQNHESRYTVSKPNIGSTDVYTADHMQAYARSAIEAHEARKASVVKQEPLTVAQIRQEVQSVGLMFTQPDIKVARAIEAAHGILATSKPEAANGITKDTQ